MSRVGEEIEDVLLLLSLTGLVSQDSEEDVVTKVSGLSRADKRRNAKLAELRRLVPADHAIVGIDLAHKKQAVVVCDHDSRVLTLTRWAADEAAAREALGLALEDGDADVRAYARQALA
jgi:hypothetical protein